MPKEEEVTGEQRKLHNGGLVTFISHKMLSNRGGRDGGMRHVWGRRETHTGIW